MFSCKKASHLISKSQDGELTQWEQFSMRFHLLICSMCRNFKRHIDFLQTLSEIDPEKLEDSLPDETLSPKARERIRKALQEKTE